MKPKSKKVTVGGSDTVSDTELAIYNDQNTGNLHFHMTQDRLLRRGHFSQIPTDPEIFSLFSDVHNIELNMATVS